MDWPLSGWGYGPVAFQLGIWIGPIPFGSFGVAPRVGVMDSHASSWPEITPTGSYREIIMGHGHGLGAGYLVPSTVNFMPFYVGLLRSLDFFGGYFQPLAWLFPSIVCCVLCICFAYVYVHVHVHVHNGVPNCISVMNPPHVCAPFDSFLFVSPMFAPKTPAPRGAPMDINIHGGDQEMGVEGGTTCNFGAHIVGQG